jgi:DNA-binding Lrp family transcriptional regulator
MTPPPEATDDLAAAILELLAHGSQPSQASIARSLDKSPSDVAKALRLLEQRREVQRFVTPGVRGRGARLVAKEGS